MNKPGSNAASPEGVLPGAPWAADSNPAPARHLESSSALHPPLIPDHDLLRVIGRGAYGEVWLARNAVGTPRAVKIVRRDQHATAESFEREFRGLQKFEPVSRAHEGFVDILTLGLLPDGAGFYYIMELADDVGQASRLPVQRASLLAEPDAKLEASPPAGRMPALQYSPHTLRAELKSRGALPADEVITLGLKLTAALAHLHAQGLVHRDVKPSDILFIGGEPKLADVGLVAAVDDARSLVGTANYIAPEGRGSPQADLYALGKVLYEAAFGKDRQEFPALPADVASRPDHASLLELNAILLKACAIDQRERYQSAEQMHAELELLRAGRSVKRRQAWQEARRHAIRLGAAAAVIITAWFLFNRSNDSTTQRIKALTPTSIFILPFRNDGTNRVGELLRSRITDAVIDGLGHIDGIKVGPRKSGWVQRNEDGVQREVLNQFGSHYAASGKVRSTSNELTATVTLHDTVSDGALWSEEFVGTTTNKSELEERIIRGVVERLGLKISDEASERNTRVLQRNHEAFELYRAPRPSDQSLAAIAEAVIERLTRVTELDPHFAHAHTDLAFTYRLLGYYDRSPRECMPLMRKHALDALKIDDTFAPAKYWLGGQTDLRLRLGGGAGRAGILGQRTAVRQHRTGTHAALPRANRRSTGRTRDRPETFAALGIHSGRNLRAIPD
jgi:serine/threonine protein kinase